MDFSIGNRIKEDISYSNNISVPSNWADSFLAEPLLKKNPVGSITSTTVNFFENVSHIAPLEGVFLGYELGVQKLRYGSILNTPEFVAQFINNVQLSVSPAYDYNGTFFYFLHSLPFNAPMPFAKIASGQTLKMEVPEENPSMLFKNSAGVYSVPTMYLAWLGGIWKYYSYEDQTNSFGFPGFDNSTYPISITRDENGNFKDLNSTLHWSGDINFIVPYYTDFIVDWIKFYKLLPTDNFRIVNSILYEDEKETIFNSAFKVNSTQYNLDRLAGIGISTNILSVLYGVFYGSGTTTNIPDVKELNLLGKLRTFPSYRYDISSNPPVELSFYASYGLLSIENLIQPKLTEMLKPEDPPEAQWNVPGTGVPADVDVFKVYSEIWQYFYVGLKNNKTYSDLKKELIGNYAGETNLRVIQSIFAEISGNVPLVWNADTNSPYFDGGDYVTKENLFDNSGDADTKELADNLDMIGEQVLRFLKIQPLSILTESQKSMYGVRNDSFVCSLYPSAGGTLGVQDMLYYLTDGIKTHLSASKSKSNASQPLLIHEVSDSVAYINMTQVIVNAIANSNKLLWYTGPFVGDSPVEVKTLEVSNLLYDNPVLVNTKNGFLQNANDYLCTNNSPAKELRTYYLSNDMTQYVTGEDTENPCWIPYEDVLEYIGNGVLNTCSNIFDQEVKNAQNILFKLLVLDAGDFDVVTVDEVDYSVAEQINYLMLYNTSLGYAYQNNFHPDAYKSGSYITLIKNNKKLEQGHLYRVMNASLTQAQYNKAKRVVGELITERELLNVASVFDSLSEGSLVSSKGKVYNLFHTASLRDLPNASSESGKYIRSALFGDQTLPKWSPYVADSDEYYVKYFGRYGSKNAVTLLLNYFFQQLDVAPTPDVLLIASDFIRVYLSNYTSSQTALGQAEANLKKTAETVAKWVDAANVDLAAALNLLNDKLGALPNDYQQEKVNENETVSNDWRILKQKTYYNVKALYDNWIQVKIDTNGTLSLSYNHNDVSPCLSTSTTAADNLFNHFLFVDRANREGGVGQNMLVNLDWLSNYFKNNFAYANPSNISIYSFLSDLAKQHSSLIHALPAFIATGGLGSTPNEGNFAGDLFKTFDFVDVTESSPKFLFQFIGNVNSMLNTEQTKALRSDAKSYSLYDDCGSGNQSNNLSNIGDGTKIPRDLANSAKGFAFVVNFGAPEQQIFSNLQIDQSEFQNTEEYFQAITQFSKERGKVQSGDLFSIFTERSYTAQVDSLGNLMIQPLMFFELVNIPLFYGTYWITNVKHQITPNDIKTTFKGVRQPMSILPQAEDVLLQLATTSIDQLLGTTALTKTAASTGTLPRKPCGAETDSVSEATSLDTTKPWYYKIDANQMAINQKKVFDLLKPKYTKAAVAAIMGNIMMESSFEPTAESKPEKGYTNYGLIQWHQSQAYASKAKLGDTVESQMNFLLNEDKQRLQSFIDAKNKPIFDNPKVSAETKFGDTNKGATYLAYLFACASEICVNCINGYQVYSTNKPFNRSRYAVDFLRRFNDPNDAGKDAAKTLYWT